MNRIGHSSHIRCPLCHEVFQAKDLINHCVNFCLFQLKSSNSSVEPFVCPLCDDLGFSRLLEQDEAVRHLKYHQSISLSLKRKAFETNVRRFDSSKDKALQDWLLKKKSHPAILPPGCMPGGHRTGPISGKDLKQPKQLSKKRMQKDEMKQQLNIAQNDQTSEKLLVSSTSQFSESGSEHLSKEANNEKRNLASFNSGWSFSSIPPPYMMGDIRRSKKQNEESEISTSSASASSSSADESNESLGADSSASSSAICPTSNTIQASLSHTVHCPNCGYHLHNDQLQNDSQSENETHDKEPDTKEEEEKGYVFLSIEDLFNERTFETKAKIKETKEDKKALQLQKKIEKLKEKEKKQAEKAKKLEERKQKKDEEKRQREEEKRKNKELKELNEKKSDTSADEQTNSSKDAKSTSIAEKSVEEMRILTQPAVKQTSDQQKPSSSPKSGLFSFWSKLFNWRRAEKTSSTDESRSPDEPSDVSMDDDNDEDEDALPSSIRIGSPINLAQASSSSLASSYFDRKDRIDNISDLSAEFAKQIDKLFSTTAASGSGISSLSSDI
ncbi:uncharacterized protein MONOS_4348 [Monocercomonoides exilis]|uniref:uncharacterized protein n=1 Tax=Monocercomonoides exilis TaxID=2049356 RepID=UPI003559A66A|nr:hypothetical protein MONOS_4348 [Monocercomonoides exilis]|eukprot:MONOS_4348.1-p1 / transcript=MONOS_4348.1 / gene=MONOS_4348 / organism=Monocercomonoides_exilis_PA203 / gene_product=unspecified product / transcript_product=unspecified product / location=Mono_scaffold00114:82712-84510(+) / protein_length=556 / sequence_SO=supercontig / SO=protein_coding / is_pseudo=false